MEDDPINESGDQIQKSVKTPVEKSVTQDALALGIVVPNKDVKSDKMKDESNASDLAKGESSKKHAKSSKGKNETIKEEDEEDDDAGTS